MDACLSHLQNVGLIRQEIREGGSHEGNQYEIFTPEEISFLTPLSRVSGGSMLSGAQQGGHAKKQGSLGSLDPKQGKQGFQSTNIEVGDESKTLFKTLKQIDDEKPILAALEMFNEAARGNRIGVNAK
jgi:hypothetical protein